MAEETREPAGRSLKRSLVRMGVALGFSAILAIPKLRRLRRNTRAWTAVRVVAIAAGACLVAIGFLSHTRAGYAVPGIILVVFGSGVRARPLKKSADEVSRELGALVVLNGGILIDATHLKKPPRASIYVTPSRLAVLSSAGHQRFEEIPLASIAAIAVRPSDESKPQANPANQQPAWDLEITWDAGEISTRFRYEGSFAEHLARVAETTLREAWKKQLPVIET